MAARNELATEYWWCYHSYHDRLPHGQARANKEGMVHALTVRLGDGPDSWENEKPRFFLSFDLVGKYLVCQARLREYLWDLLSGDHRM